MAFPAAADWWRSLPPRSRCRAGRDGARSRRQTYEFQYAGVMIEGSNDVGRGRAVSVGGCRRGAITHKMHDEVLLHRQVSGDECGVQEVPGRHALSTRTTTTISCGTGTTAAYPEGWGNKPVTWVSLEDARAYAQWAGKRLPHEWEWQYAAQGTDGRTVSVGQRLGRARPFPARTRAATCAPPTDVDAHPQGASPFGVMDLVGNVWQWTDEFVDEHTRAAILKGGSYYQPQGSLWYFPQAYKLTEHGKYLLMAPCKDRAGTVGFRCVVDAE